MSDQSYLNCLNEQQRAAVAYLEGPELVIAGAGSGKTRVVAYKIVHLLHGVGLEPWKILALTFTNKAAREMRERIEALVGPEKASRLWMGTFHSIFSRILHQNAERLGFKSNFTIYDSADSRNLIKSIVKELGLDEKVYKAATVASVISNAKNQLISPEEYALSREMVKADAAAGRPKIAQIYHIYRDRCKVAGAMDFDDLLYYTNVLFDTCPDVAERYQNTFHYILVDEYQDTNMAQHRIIEKLVKPHGRLCVVGDDAQSIYSFRGAEIGNILNLNEDFPSLRVFKLERNYRSTQNITDAAGSLIVNNKHQLPKKVYSENEPGDKIEVIKCYSDNEEAYKVTARITKRRSQTGDSYSDFAILYRTNAQSRVIEEALRKRNVPYRIYGGLSFYQRKEVKDAVAYFRLAVNPDDDEALRRVVNYPVRGIGDTTMQRISHAAISEGKSLWEIITTPELIPADVKGAARKKLAAFADIIYGFIEQNERGVAADELAYNIIKETGLLAQFEHDNTPENVSKRENLQELYNGVHTYVELAREQGDDEVGMSQFLTTVSLATDQDSDDGLGDDRVTLMTVHAAKGLEFNNVFIVGVEDGLFPSEMSKSSMSQIEEERRLLYVAITRARNFCMMSYASSRFRNGTMMSQNISPFLREIDRKYLSTSTGSDLRTLSAPQSRSIPGFSRSMMGSARSLSDLRRPSPTPQPAAVTGDFVKHDASELSVGMTIRHQQFGTGEIIEIDTSTDSPRMTAVFEGDVVDSRKLLLKFAKFSILS